MIHVQAHRVRYRSFLVRGRRFIIRLSPQRVLSHIGRGYPSTGDFILLMNAGAHLFSGLSCLDVYVMRPTPPQTDTLAREK